MTTELSAYQGLLDVRTGELLEPTVENAERVIVAARAMKAQVNEIVTEATAFLAEESARRGTKTLHGEGVTVTLTGGPGIDYDPTELRRELEFAGCPEDRIEAAVVMEVSYKINRSVLSQLAGANPEYKAAIQRAELEVDRPYRASIKLRRNTDEQ